jgi:AcrR family transcriptional regulator
MTAVVARSGVPRATVYSRWRNRRALVEAALERAVAATLTTPRGDSPETVHEIARAAQEFLSLPSVRSLLPAIIGAARAGPSREPVGQCAVFDAYHGRVRSAYRLAAGDTVLPGDQDLPDLVADVVLGALVARALRTTSPPEDEATAQIVDIVIRGVRGGL